VVEAFRKLSYIFSVTLSDERIRFSVLIVNDHLGSNNGLSLLNTLAASVESSPPPTFFLLVPPSFLFFLILSSLFRIMTDSLFPVVAPPSSITLQFSDLSGPVMR